MKTTTTRLHLDRRARLAYWWHSRGERQVRDGLWGGVLITMLLLVHSLLKPTEAPLQPIVQQPAVMIVATARPQPPLPTLTPWPTPAPVIVEVPVEVPVVQQVPVYVEVPVAQPIYVDTYTPPTAEPIVPTLAPQQQVLLDRQQWAEDAQRQREIQNHYVEPPQAGGSGKMPAPDIGDIPASGAAEWCQAAANAGVVRCVEGP